MVTCNELRLFLCFNLNDFRPRLKRKRVTALFFSLICYPDFRLPERPSPPNQKRNSARNVSFAWLALRTCFLLYIRCCVVCSSSSSSSSSTFFSCCCTALLGRLLCNIFLVSKMVPFHKRQIKHKILTRLKTEQFHHRFF